MKLANTVVLLLGALTRFVVVAQLASKVSIVHINDHHSNIDELSLDLPRSMIPVTINGSQYILPNVPSIRMKYGSFARVVALIKKMSTEATTAGYDVLRLHAGDAITGTNYFTFYGSVVDAAALNLAGFDAMTLGNHEFDKGDTFLADFIKNLTFPVLSANVVPNKTSALINATGSNLFRPYIIKTLANGERVGVCGITTKLKTEQSSFPDPGTTLRVEREAAIECTQNLTSMGINKVVLLTHIGYTNDLQQMATIPGVDVVVGGDSHTLLGNATFNAANFVPLGPYATMIGKVCVVQAWEYGKIVGRLDVDFDALGNVTSCFGTPQIPFSTSGTYQIGTSGTNFLNSTASAILSQSLLDRGIFVNVVPDSAVSSAIEPFRLALASSGARVIGSTNQTICHGRSQLPQPNCPGRDLSSCLGGGGVCYLVAQGFLFNVIQADFAIQNGGGCRADIPGGNITFSTMFTILPFSNTLTTARMTGAQIKSVLEDAVEFIRGGGGTGAYPFAAGLRWSMDYSAPFGSRFTNIEMNRRLLGTWTPLDMMANYTIVTNNFLSGGRDGYITFRDPAITASVVDTFVEYAQSFVNFIESKKSISEPPLSDFSSQRINFANGRVCDARSGIIAAPVTAPVAAPVAVPAPKAATSAPKAATSAPKAATSAPKAPTPGTVPAPISKPVAPVAAPVPANQCPAADDCRRNGSTVSRKIFGICLSRCVRNPRRFLRRGWKCGKGCE